MNNEVSPERKKLIKKIVKRLRPSMDKLEAYDLDISVEELKERKRRKN